jgi:hypothetical protein
LIETHTNENLYELWLVQNPGLILLKEFKSDQKAIRVKDLTIVSTQDTEIEIRIMDEWSILFDIEDLLKIYEYKDAGVLVSGYVLEIENDERLVDIIYRKSPGEFVGYDTLKLLLNKSNLQNQFNLSLTHLVKWFDRNIHLLK